MRIFIITILMLSLFSCEEFQTESFSTSNVDKKAIAAIADSVSISFSTKALKAFNNKWENTALDTILVDLRDTLNTSGTVLSVLDTAYFLKIPSTNDTSYATFSGEASRIIIFIEDYIDIKILDSNGNPSDPDDTSMELPAIFESLYGTTSKEYYIRSRYVFNSVPDNAIFQFLKNDQTDKNAFKLIINQ
ncbi:MAG: hypothetical protein D8M58_08455 [Calditrichaeota bacterium]|nr:MAG: hypothetical protein DWQ03_18035 [Calditrichota bacterium]MBL1205413.1 hypothetical protein [Calditrichota bacterium]NOG45242.1 hypothetical protein [Calditrichota bacterium]